MAHNLQDNHSKYQTIHSIPHYADSSFKIPLKSNTSKFTNTGNHMFNESRRRLRIRSKTKSSSRSKSKNRTFNSHQTGSQIIENENNTRMMQLENEKLKSLLEEQIVKTNNPLNNVQDLAIQAINESIIKDQNSNSSSLAESSLFAVSIYILLFQDWIIGAVGITLSIFYVIKKNYGDVFSVIFLVIAAIICVYFYLKHLEKIEAEKNKKFWINLGVESFKYWMNGR